MQAAMIVAMIAAPLAGAIADPAAAPASAGSAMSPTDARAYLQSQGIDPLPENLTNQIINGDAKTVDALIAAGVDVKAKTSLPQSSLELAAMSCSNHEVSQEATAHMIDSLVASGADPNAPGMLGPLMTAAQQCGALPVKRLIAAGARLESRTPQGFTPLSMALITKHYEAAQALIDAGARISPEVAAKFTKGSDDATLNAMVRKATR